MARAIFPPTHARFFATDLHGVREHAEQWRLALKALRHELTIRKSAPPQAGNPTESGRTPRRFYPTRNRRLAQTGAEMIGVTIREWLRALMVASPACAQVPRCTVQARRLLDPLTRHRWHPQLAAACSPLRASTNRG